MGEVYRPIREVIRPGMTTRDWINLANKGLFVYRAYPNPKPHATLESLRESEDECIASNARKALSREELRDEFPGLLDLPIMHEHEWKNGKTKCGGAAVKRSIRSNAEIELFVKFFTDRDSGVRLLDKINKGDRSISLGHIIDPINGFAWQEASVVGVPMRRGADLIGYMETDVSQYGQNANKDTFRPRVDPKSHLSSPERIAKAKIRKRKRAPFHESQQQIFASSKDQVEVCATGKSNDRQIVISGRMSTNNTGTNGGGGASAVGGGGAPASNAGAAGAGGAPIGTGTDTKAPTNPTMNMMLSRAAQHFLPQDKTPIVNTPAPVQQQQQPPAQPAVPQQPVQQQAPAQPPAGSGTDMLVNNPADIPNLSAKAKLEVAARSQANTQAGIEGIMETLSKNQGQMPPQLVGKLTNHLNQIAEGVVMGQTVGHSLQNDFVDSQNQLSITNRKLQGHEMMNVVQQQEMFKSDRTLKLAAAKNNPDLTNEINQAYDLLDQMLVQANGKQVPSEVTTPILSRLNNRISASPVMEVNASGTNNTGGAVAGGGAPAGAGLAGGAAGVGVGAAASGVGVGGGANPLAGGVAANSPSQRQFQMFAIGKQATGGQELSPLALQYINQHAASGNPIVDTDVAQTIRSLNASAQKTGSIPNLQQQQQIADQAAAQQAQLDHARATAERAANLSAHAGPIPSLQQQQQAADMAARQVQEASNKYQDLQRQQRLATQLLRSQAPVPMQQQSPYAYPYGPLSFSQPLQQMTPPVGAMAPPAPQAPSSSLGLLSVDQMNQLLSMAQGQPTLPQQNMYAPPQGQYGALPPQGQYGALPPQGQYGALPPQGQYGALPPQGQYGALPPQGQYGASIPQGQYGSLPQQNAYAPPQGQYGYQHSPYAAPQQQTPQGLGQFGYGPKSGFQKPQQQQQQSWPVPNAWQGEVSASGAGGNYEQPATLKFSVSHRNMANRLVKDSPEANRDRDLNKFTYSDNYTPSGPMQGEVDASGKGTGSESHTKTKYGYDSMAFMQNLRPFDIESPLSNGSQLRMNTPMSKRQRVASSHTSSGSGDSIL